MLEKKRLTVVVLTCLLFLAAIPAAAEEWTPVRGKYELNRLMSGLKAERTLPGGEVHRGEYLTDGTGKLYAWGAEIPRTWSVKANDQVCITAKKATICYQLERSSKDPRRYRAREVVSGTVAEFEVSEDGRAIVKAGPGEAGAEGGAAAPSADELAAELSNPNTSVATLTLRNQFRWFDGDLPDADDQWSFMMLFQPSLPFVLDGGDKVLWRPAVPLFFKKPVFDASTAEFEGEAGLGDIAFDLAYAPRTDGGKLFAYGFITSLPTATNGSLGTSRWTLGPEVLIGKMNSWGLVGLFPNHQWDVAGWGDADINLTTILPLFVYLPGGGYNVGTAPIITYDWISEQWTVPLQINVGKTVMLSGRPWKLSVELNYYVEKPDAFGPEWMLSLNIAPVVKNGLAGWFGLGRN
ncbi:MAG: hypothetical protein JRH03_09740 [Deltaproteobacteria bacterium]|nr:hypothetical protein [Deltaproteobacteria bacterium]